MVTLYTYDSPTVLQDREITCKMLKSSTANAAVRFGTGYFNPTKEYLDIILKESKASYTLLVSCIPECRPLKSAYTCK